MREKVKNLNLIYSTSIPVFTRRYPIAQSSEPGRLMLKAFDDY